MMPGLSLASGETSNYTWLFVTWKVANESSLHMQVSLPFIMAD
jgi:hypothetical protein